ncbi:Sulfotransferase domain protein [Rubripirellula obstinata]|uniref:Sulfotransferase domain protein n=1 Tax=Rubripirellula obstinata TaxID=406547 RepID=A0A5B1CHX6_9BACT|nr:sulfotransferase domain-containing protein [Rubripirellula obstinata]KAA1259821.1 Sulfotransferase domain protein [Rubripirellula obstinata]
MTMYREGLGSKKPETAGSGQPCGEEARIETFVASHRRSGTHLTLDNLVANFDAFNSGFKNFDDPRLDQNVALYKTHLDGFQAATKLNNRAKIVYVIRDGRDVMVSLYKYAKTHDSEVRSMDFSEFLRSPNPYSHSEKSRGLNRVEYWNYHVESWLTQTKFSIKCVTFDGWKFSFHENLAALGLFLQLAPKSVSKSMVMKPSQRWTKNILRKFGFSKNTAIQFQGGHSQAWKKHFDSDSLGYFCHESKKTYEMVSENLGFDFEL